MLDTPLVVACAAQVAGDVLFWDRSEVKDVVAYLRLAVNSSDSMAFERIASRPSRSLGEKAVVQAAVLSCRAAALHPRIRCTCPTALTRYIMHCLAHVHRSCNYGGH
jgi:hypothetical protein